MRRGTTPILTFTVDDDIDLTALQDVYLTIRQQGAYAVTKHKGSEGFEITGAHEVQVLLSQKETLKFKAGRAACQLRGVNSSGQAFATDIEYVTIDDVLLQEVIPL